MYVNRNGVLALIDQQRINLADVECLDLNSVTKIMQNFGNPKQDDTEFQVDREGSDQNEIDIIRKEMVVIWFTRIIIFIPAELVICARSSLVSNLNLWLSDNNGVAVRVA